ncbi:MAG: tyrosine-type recombinase/integrase [Verrucomicrobiia bacterium]
MKFPRKVKHRGKHLATIYGKSKAYPQYRVAWSVSGKRRMKAFDHFGGKDGALTFADTLVADLAKGSRVTSLTPDQANDALAALQRLDALRIATGKRVSLHGALSEYAEAVEQLSGLVLGDSHLSGVSLSEAIRQFRNVVACVKRAPIADAVADYLKYRESRAKAKAGERPKRSPVYEYHVTFWLNQFAETFPATAVCDLTKDHLDTYIAQFSELSAKTRNDRRAAVKMFLGWCKEKDYLPQNHRLFEATGFKAEDKDDMVIDFYRPNELRALLSAADADVLPVIALNALGGLRIEECLRLDWSEVWSTPGHVEVSARIAKGRKRRMVVMGESLAQWLEPYRQCTGRVCDLNPMQFNRRFVSLRESLKIPARRNGLRHGFVTYHLGVHSDENLTAQQAGNSPQMIHEHYKAPATKAEAEKWFSVAPGKAVNVLPMASARA